MITTTYSSNRARPPKPERKLKTVFQPPQILSGKSKIRMVTGEKTLIQLHNGMTIADLKSANVRLDCYKENAPRGSMCRHYAIRLGTRDEWDCETLAPADCCPPHTSLHFPQGGLPRHVSPLLEQPPPPDCSEVILALGTLLAGEEWIGVIAWCLRSPVEDYIRVTVSVSRKWRRASPPMKPLGSLYIKENF